MQQGTGRRCVDRIHTTMLVQSVRHSRLVARAGRPALKLVVASAGA